MIINQNEDGIAIITLTRHEAQVLLNALTAAKIQVGEGTLLYRFGVGHSGADILGVNIEHLRDTLTEIVEQE